MRSATGPSSGWPDPAGRGISASLTFPPPFPDVRVEVTRVMRQPTPSPLERGWGSGLVPSAERPGAVRPGRFDFEMQRVFRASVQGRVRLVRG